MVNKFCYYNILIYIFIYIYLFIFYFINRTHDLNILFLKKFFYRLEILKMLSCFLR